MAARKKSWTPARRAKFQATMAAKKTAPREEPRAAASSGEQPPNRQSPVEALMINGKPYGIDEAMSVYQAVLKLRAMR